MKAIEKIFHIRGATSQDLPQVVALLAACQLPTADLTPDALVDFLIAWDGEHIVGVVGMEVYGHVALLRSLAVRGLDRECGIGSQLANQIETIARGRGIQALYLLTTTAREFFVQRGYKMIERSQVPKVIQETVEFSSICPSSAVCMIKNWGEAGPAHLYAGKYQTEGRARRDKYLLAGGFLVIATAVAAVITVALGRRFAPRIMSQMLAGKMQKMIAQMEMGDCTPPEI